MDLDRRAKEKNAGLQDEMLLKVIDFSYKDQTTSEEVRRKVQAAVGEYDELLIMFKKR